MRESTTVAAKKYNTESLAQLVIESIQDKKGQNIVSLNLKNIPEAVADYFIICHTDTSTHARAILDYIEFELKQNAGLKRVRIEGRDNGEWILADIGDIVVHIFLTEKREFYQLEDLWSDAFITKYDS